MLITLLDLSEFGSMQNMVSFKKIYDPDQHVHLTIILCYKEKPELLLIKTLIIRIYFNYVACAKKKTWYLIKGPVL